MKFILSLFRRRRLTVWVERLEVNLPLFAVTGLMLPSGNTFMNRESVKWGREEAALGFWNACKAMA